jgi:hypothetical protein
MAATHLQALGGQPVVSHCSAEASDTRGESVV